MKLSSILALSFCAVCLAGCTESGVEKGHAGAQASLEKGDVIHEPSGAENQNDVKNNIIYGKEHFPLRMYESSVLNEPGENSRNDPQGRGYRINGSGYGPERKE